MAAAAAYLTGVSQPCVRVRTALVTVPVPSLDLGTSVLQGQEPMRVQAFVAKTAVGALDESVVGRLTRP